MRHFKTRNTAETGVTFGNMGPGIGWSHFDGPARVGPVYASRAELLADHESYIGRAWRSADEPNPAELRAALAELLADLIQYEPGNPYRLASVKRAGDILAGAWQSFRAGSVLLERVRRGETGGRFDFPDMGPGSAELVAATFRLIRAERTARDDERGRAAHADELAATGPESAATGPSHVWAGYLSAKRTHAALVAETAALS